MKSQVAVLGTSGLFWAALLGLTAFAGPERQQPLQRRQLDDLTPGPVEKLDQQLFSPTAQPESPKPPGSDAPGAPAEADRQFEREMGRVRKSEADSPLVNIARTMHHVQERIGQADSGPQTQQMQGRILKDLEDLLQQARRNCQACQAACGTPQQAVAQRERIAQPKDVEAAKHVKRKNSGGGSDPSQAIAGPDKVSPGMKAVHQPNMEEMRSLLKALWGELPQREREQMLQLPVEEFLPKYELLIEQYFKRLSEPREQSPVSPRP